MFRRSPTSRRPPERGRAARALRYRAVRPRRFDPGRYQSASRRAPAAADRDLPGRGEAAARSAARRAGRPRARNRRARGLLGSVARACPAVPRTAHHDREGSPSRRARPARLCGGRLAERVQLIEGAALAVLPALAPGFDAVFVDADKEPLAQYFDWSVRLLRPGGLLLCDNAFFHGSVVDDADRSPGTEGARAFNRLAATDPRVVSAVVPIRDGLVIGVRVPG